MTESVSDRNHIDADDISALTYQYYSLLRRLALGVLRYAVLATAYGVAPASGQWPAGQTGSRLPAAGWHRGSDSERPWPLLTTKE